MDVKIESSWKEALQAEFNAPYFAQLTAFVREEYARTRCYPKAKDIFRAFNVCPLQDVKVLILGQDPYHGEGQAHGLCFSVNRGVDIPPSLLNIYKELHSDIGMPIPKHGDLTGWATQGVLLLNDVLTVRANQAASHQKRGWETFTDAVIRIVNASCDHVVFMLWGRYAQDKARLIDPNKHLVLSSVHPSPLSASRGFFGNKHFSKANTFLTQKNKMPVNWGILNEQ
jgi:uracil-DNA glycosylase